jgi:hypothetical protein
MKASLYGCICVAVTVVCIAGCGSGGKEKCASIAGSWTIAQHCEGDFEGQQVAVTQTGCAIACGSPFDGWTGSMTGSSITMSGPAGNDTLTCSGSVTLTSINLTCPGSGGTCTVQMTRQGGDNCINVAGTWTITEHCESHETGQQVSVTQDGCSITYSSPFTGWTGSITGSSITMSGPADGETLTCTGTATETSISVSCPGKDGTCDVTLSKGSSQTNVVGQACSGASDCPSPYFCNQAGFCTRDCTTHADCGCPASGSCPNACVELDATSAVCLRLCETSADCDVGICDQILASGGSVCIPPA